MSESTLQQFEATLTEKAPYMANVVQKGRAFSESWETEFNETLSRMFKGDNSGLSDAAKGYVEFALDALRLHKRFEKDLDYIHKTYEEVAAAVYHNEDYMNNLYLPGILLSQYLWPHHYSQLQFFWREFVPLMRAAKVKTFADIGVGTGFYSRQALAADPEIRGTGYDISEHALAYAARQVEAFGFQERWTTCKQNILTDPPDARYSFVISVEVLEHLEDPVAFIKGLKSILAPHGFAYITAAISAPNADHIHLYWNCDDVIKELVEGGFEVIQYQSDKAYEPKADEPVPVAGAFICR